MNDPELTIFGAKPRWQYGATSRAGRDDLATTSPRISRTPRPDPAARRSWRAARGDSAGQALTKSQLEPNRVEKLNLRGNVVADLGETAEARVNVGYTQSETRPGLWEPVQLGIPSASPTGPYGTGSDPIDALRADARRRRVEPLHRERRLEWEPATWLSTHATLGLDLPRSHRYNLAQRGAWEDYNGTVGRTVTVRSNHDR